MSKSKINWILNDKKIQKSPIGAYKNRSEIQRISLSGVFFALVILFQFLERYMGFANTYLNLNFSIIFILPIFYFSGPLYGIIVLILRFAIGPSVGTLGYSVQGIISHFILFVSTTTIILFLYFYSFMFQNIESHLKKYIFISLLTVLSSSITLAFINAIFFTPLFWWSYSYIPSLKISSAVNLYESQTFVQVKHFGIPNYWQGIFAVYTSGNIVKFGLAFILNYPLSKVIRHYY